MSHSPPSKAQPRHGSFATIEIPPPSHIYILAPLLEHRGKDLTYVFSAVTGRAVIHVILYTCPRQAAVPPLDAVLAFLLAITTVLHAKTLMAGASAATATLTGALAAATSEAGHNGGHSGGHGECKLLGPFALVVQAALGGLALMSLVYKRWRERPQRPLKVWAFDVSKQVVGSILLHVANLLMSMLSSGQFSIKLGPRHIVRNTGYADDNYQPNPCSFYLLNLAIDTTVGIPILIVLLRICTAFFRLTPFGKPPESIESGNYGIPPRAYWWFKQSIIYFLGLLGMKFCVLIIFLVLPWISRVGDWALRWTEGNEDLQVFFVMLFFPVIMNATQYYIIDSFIKNQKSSDNETLSMDVGEGIDSAVDPRPFLNPVQGEEFDLDDDDDVTVTESKDAQVKGESKRSHSGRKNHKSQADDEGSLTLVGSSRSSQRDRLFNNVDSEDEATSFRK